jgi:hypothetical protein
VGPQAFATYEQFHYPLTFDINVTLNADGSADQTSIVHQGYESDLISPGLIRAVSNHLNSTDTIVFAADGSYSNENQSSNQTYLAGDSTGYHYSCTLEAANNVLTNIGRGCSAK